MHALLTMYQELTPLVIKRMVSKAGPTAGRKLRQMADLMDPMGAMEAKAAQREFAEKMGGLAESFGTALLGSLFKEDSPKATEVVDFETTKLQPVPTQPSSEGGGWKWLIQATRRIGNGTVDRDNPKPPDYDHLFFGPFESEEAASRRISDPYGKALADADWSLVYDDLDFFAGSLETYARPRYTQAFWDRQVAEIARLNGRWSLDDQTPPEVREIKLPNGFKHKAHASGRK